MLTLSTSPGPLDRPPQLSFSEAAENGRVSGPKAAENGRKLAGRKAASGTGLRPISRCRFSKKSEKPEGRGGVLFSVVTQFGFYGYGNIAIRPATIDKTVTTIEMKAQHGKASFWQMYSLPPMVSRSYARPCFPGVVVSGVTSGDASMDRSCV